MFFPFIQHSWKFPWTNFLAQFRLLCLYLPYILRCFYVLVAQLCPTLCSPWTVARQAPRSVEFSRQEFWSGLPIFSFRGSSQPRDWTSTSVSPALAGRFFTTVPPGKPPKRRCVCVDPLLTFQSCLTLCNPMDYNLPGFSVCGIFPATILEWIAIPFSRGCFRPNDRTQGLLHCRQILYPLSTREVP